MPTVSLVLHSTYDIPQVRAIPLELIERIHKEARSLETCVNGRQYTIMPVSFLAYLPAQLTMKLEYRSGAIPNQRNHSSGDTSNPQATESTMLLVPSDPAVR